MREPANIRIAVVVLIALIVAAARTEGANAPAIPRVRTHSPTLAALIDRATRESATFRGLIDAFDATDGLVYVEPGECRHGAAACLLHTVVNSAGFRILNVRMKTQRRDIDLMGTIGHELRHALEVLSDPRVSTDVAMQHFYRTVGTSTRGDFETRAAIDAGDAVRRDLRAFSRLVDRTASRH